MQHKTTMDPSRHSYGNALFFTFFFLFSILEGMTLSCWAFSPAWTATTPTSTTAFLSQPSASSALFAGENGGGDDPAEVIAKRITVKGDVQGGYYRSCVKNEASRFRKLVGTMSPPDETDEAEIYVEGKRKMVDGFVRWCKKGDVGLSQVIRVSDVIDEQPTGLYDDFYVKVKE